MSIRSTICAGAAGLLLCACSAQPTLPDPLEAGWQGQPVCEVLQENDALRLLRCEFAPGVGHELHEHAPHFGYALSSATMRIEDEEGERERLIPAGTNWMSAGVTRHEVLNVGTTTGVYLIMEPK